MKARLFEREGSEEAREREHIRRDEGNAHCGLEEHVEEVQGEGWVGERRHPDPRRHLRVGVRHPAARSGLTASIPPDMQARPGAHGKPARQQVCAVPQARLGPRGREDEVVHSPLQGQEPGKRVLCLELRQLSDGQVQGEGRTGVRDGQAQVVAALCGEDRMHQFWRLSALTILWERTCLRTVAC